MKAMRERRQASGLREIRLALPDLRLPAVQRRVAAQIAALAPSKEAEAMNWIEAISEFDTEGASAEEDARSVSGLAPAPP